MSESVRRTEIQDSEAIGVVFEPEGESDHFAVMLSGSSGGIPEAPARRLAENGITAFALGYHGAPGLPPDLVEIPIEALERGIALFRARFARQRSVGVVGISRGAELALLLAAYLGDAIGRVVAVAPSHVVWSGLKAPGPGDRRTTSSSWSWQGVPLAFLQHRAGIQPVFNERGLRTDVYHDLTSYAPAEIDPARIPVERSVGPILLLSGDDDHMWPAAPMAEEIVRRMQDHGRGGDVTNVVYPGAGHIFLMRDFLPPAGAGNAPPFDFGGTAPADEVANRDAWRRVVTFLQGSRLLSGTGAVG
jgi:pimeloyl-ACP methyl ester carboxylesterase